MISGIICSSFNHKQKDKDFKGIDLVYITPQLVASATPSEGWKPKFYRVKSNVLSAYFNKYHQSNWKVWCLQEDHEMSYDSFKFGEGDKVSRRPIKDHHPPTFSDLVQTISKMHEYIEKDTTNVAVVHCKHGKGRTGMVVSAYLIMFGNMSVERATAKFTEKRIRAPLIKGISIQSQLRYLGYLETWKYKLNEDSRYLSTSFVKLARIVIENPKVDEVELTIAPQALGTEDIRRTHSGGRKWVVNMKPHQHVIQDSCEYSPFPPDLLVQFRGYIIKRGYRVLVSIGELSFNCDFEDPEMNTTIITDQMHGYGPKASVLSIFNHDLHNLGHAKFLWKDTDGFYGTVARGFQCFDSIRFIWSSDLKNQDESEEETP